MYSDYGLLHWSSCLCKFNKLNAPFSYEAVCYWNCSVISQRSCSEAPDKLRVRQGSVHQHGGQWDVASLFVHWGSLLLCAASSRAGSLSPAPRLSVRFYFAPRLSLLTVCAFFYLFSPPRTFLTFSIYVSVHHSFPLLISISICSSSSRSSSLPPVSIWLRSCQLTLPPPHPGLCCAVAAHRSDQDRWSQMISGLYSFLQETAWYCCWHDALSGCPQVQQYHNSICQRS